MFDTPLNNRTVTVTMKRIDLCNLMLLCTSAAQRMEAEGQMAQKWLTLHDKLKNALEAFDKKQG